MAILERLAFFADSRIDFWERDGLTFHQLLARSALRARTLRDAGLRAGEVALIFLPIGSDLIETFFATMIAGGIPSIMAMPSDRQDPLHFWEQHRALFSHIGAGFIITDLPIADPAGLTVIGQPHPADQPLDIPSPKGSDIAFLQHSSGTTGRKKGVVITFDQLERQVNAYAPAIQLDSNSVVVSWLPLYHDMGMIACFVAPILAGASIVYLDPHRWVARPRALFAAIEKHRGTHVWLPNFAFLFMSETVQATYDLSSVHRFINCSERCTPNAFDVFTNAFESSGVRSESLSSCYAMAEAVFAVSQSPGAPRRLSIDRNALEGVGRPVSPNSSSGVELLSCGPLVPGVEAAITVDGLPAPEYITGEIWLRGDFIFSGYYKDPPRTAEVFSDGWYKTRDIGFMADDELFVLGRLDDMIIVNGRNIYAHEVEMEVGAMSGIRSGRVAAFAQPDVRAGTEALVIAAEIQDASAISVAAVSERVSDVFGVVPRDVVLLPPKSLLKTTSGKIDRATNQKRYAEGTLKPWM